MRIRNISRILNRIQYYCFLMRYHLNMVNTKTREKVRFVMGFGEKNSDAFSSDEEQALPGYKKYKKSGWYKYMLSRYLYSIEYSKNKKVLDCGCGYGWGTFLLDNFASNITAIDINTNALDFARHTWPVINSNFQEHSILDLPNLGETFDVILSFEVIEHLSKNDGEKYLENMSKVLREKGRLIMSSTFPDMVEGAIRLKEENVYHLHIYTKTEITDLLRRNNFNIKKMWGNFLIVAQKQGQKD